MTPETPPLQAEAELPPASPPATVAEAAKVLDLRKFPLPDSAEPTRDVSLARLSYQARGTVAEALDHIRKVLVSQEWEALPHAYSSDEAGSASYRRGDYKLSVSVFRADDPEKGPLASVMLIQHGNIRLRQLPIPDDAKLLFESPVSTTFVTEKSVDTTAAALRERLLEAGWTPYGSAAETQYYKQNAVKLAARVATAPAQEGKTIIDCSTELMSLDLPAPADATDVRYNDGPTQLFLEVPGDRETLMAFYRQALGERGWKATTDNPIEVGFRKALIFRHPDGDLLELEMTDLEKGTRALLKHQTQEQLAEEERRLKEELAKKKKKENEPLPKVTLRLPADAGEVAATKGSLAFTTPAGKAKDAVAALQKQLVDAGWKADSTALEPMAGAVALSREGQSLTISYLDTGVLPPEISITIIGAELEVAK